ncbi:SEL1-like repeat protein [Microvirga terricola]|uniref:Localization factor PodJL n=1 Tax=Microvirga terricola TaxID=2719797 RepID=A0ABX0VGJ3_9HYPH|nr:SEL1-like repeat protein [Microvirga terricola]NIX78155.1 hypothetical protein [Microvirga terricola]
MRRHVLPTPDDLNRDAREVAEIAARRAGLSLEEWLAATLASRAEEPEPAPQQTRRHAFQDLESIVARITRTASKPPRDDYEVLMGAVAAQNERKARDQAERTAVALESMAGWIEHAEERLNETTRTSADHHDRIASALSQALSALKDRLDAVEQAAAERPTPAPARIEFPVHEAIKALEPLSETLVGLRTDMSRLTEKLDQPASPAWTPAVEGIRSEIERLSANVGSLATREEIAALDHNLRTIAGEMDQGPSAKDMLTIARAVASLSRQIQGLSEDLGEGVHKRLGAEIDLIKRKVDGIAETGVDRTVIDFLSSQIVDMRHDLARRAEPQQIERLTGDVAALSRQIAELREHQVGRTDFATLKTSLQNVCSALERTVAAQDANDVPGKIQDLSRRIDILASRPEPEPANLDPIAEQLALLTERMANVSDRRQEQHDALSAMMSRLSSQVQSVAESVPSQEPVLRRFDQLEDEMRRIGQQADTTSVELMLRTISTRLEEQPVSTAAFAALEKRLMTLADQWSNAPAEPLRDVVAQATAHLKTLQSEADVIAERAVRAALKEVQPNPANNDLDALKQGFVELKALQTRSETKTQQTLRAVHDALETLVSRFPEHVPMQRHPSFAQPADEVAPADRLEAAVRRLHAAALSQMEEVSAETARGPEPESTPASGFPSPDSNLSQVRATFIAAARRASQTEPTSTAPVDALEELTETRTDDVSYDDEEQDLSPPSLIERLRRSFESHRRPLLFGLAFLILAAGTAQILSSGQPAQRVTAKVQPEIAAQAQAEAAIAQVAVSALNAAVPPDSVALFRSASLMIPAAPKFGVDPATVGELPAQLPASLISAASSGDATAIYEIAARAMEGRGIPQDMALAARLYERAAQAGFVPAQERLAMLHDKGLGVARDARLAATWYERAALGGNARAMHNLATLLASGANGKPDYAAALRWYSEAAEAGIRDSQFNMGILLARGLGIRPDLAKAYKWFALAAALGDTDAAKKRDEVAAKLSAADLSTAKTLVEQWRPRAVDPTANDVPPAKEGQTAALNRIFASRS